MCNIEFFWKALVNIKLFINNNYTWLIPTCVVIFGFYLAGRRHKSLQRAYIVPDDDAGGINSESSVGVHSWLYIKLKNNGKNPAKNLSVQLIGINSADVKGVNKDVQPTYVQNRTIRNPMGEKSVQKIVFEEKYQITLLEFSYVIVNIEWEDTIYRRKYHDTHYWHINRNGFENISDKDITILKKYNKEQQKNK